MLSGIAEVIEVNNELEAQVIVGNHDLERESCDIRGKTVDFEEELEEHKNNQHNFF